MRYEGVAGGLPASMDVTVEDDRWRADAEVAGTRYSLEGRLESGQLRGTVTELGSGQQSPLLASITGGGIELLVPVQGRLVATEGRGAAATTASPSEGSESEGIDPRLVGVWLWTDASFGGDVSITLQERLILNADGTYAYGDARAVGGGTGFGVDTGTDGSAETGRWRTDGSVVLISQGGDYAPYARYSTDGRSLLLTFADGSKRLWQRAGHA